MRSDERSATLCPVGLVTRVSAPHVARPAVVPACIPRAPDGDCWGSMGGVGDPPADDVARLARLVAGGGVGYPPAGDVPRLAKLVAGGGVVVLSGAGLSTESGIPDYRGPTGARRPVTPMTYQVFTADPAARRRYWARSHLGWRVVARAAPNDGHRAVAELQRQGLLSGIVTQNVDRLHTLAGARDVVELHGDLDRVVCLDGGHRSAREELDGRLRAANRDWHARVQAVNPDGDVDLADEDLDGFTAVNCAVCGGRLKPDVVFFGETVPADRVQHCFALVEAARLVLVLGSSLTVMSGYRFVLRAGKLGIPVAIVNAGPTRGDDRAAVRVDGALGRVLPELVRAVSPGTAALPDPAGDPGPAASAR